ncbi:hypothetical protein [Carboxylicivirga marina]|uniref:Restriction endonuclease type IV Mrr domain-containing protein n=1 Tax=Carboxylicivirga marina TaxID=2800988 RepID=A0ABS1HPW5_9BACT|nr:hypothetical protein [Carboxylicivirga marina]MBK3519719.1 hypothetical protein [Carboxylicivirga marina]
MAKKITLNKDHSLKLLCKELYKQMGFCTHYEVLLRTKSYISSYKTHDISDIDVLGYKFNSDLSLFKIGSECKSGESSALEELFKFLGVFDYYKLDRGYLIKSKIHQNAREVAIKNGIRCFTEAEIRQLLLGFGIDIEKKLSIENAKYLKLTRSLASFKEKNDKLIEYLKFDFWNKEDWKNIHNIIHLFSNPSSNLLFKDQEVKSSEKQVFYHTLELFSYSLLFIIGQSMVLNYSDVKSSINNSLYGGAESLNEKRKIHDLVSQATSNNDSFEPNWHSDLINISTRLSESTYASSKIPEMIQYIIENSFYESKVSIKSEDIKDFPDLTRKFTQDLMHFLTKHCGLEKEIFEDFMKL